MLPSESYPPRTHLHRLEGPRKLVVTPYSFSLVKDNVVPTSYNQCNLMSRIILTTHKMPLHFKWAYEIVLEFDF